MRATLHTDGAARRKLSEPTGPAGIGAVLRSESGLQMALDAGVTDIDAYIDSPVVAGHLLKGAQGSGGPPAPLVERERQLLDLFSTSSLARVPRALNAHADKLANQGIDHAINQGASRQLT